MKAASLLSRRAVFFLILTLSFLGACRQSSFKTPPGFEIHPDFRLDLVAAEPLVFDPVDMEFDENGRAFVLEMPGYPLRDEDSRLVLLIDENDDGFYDRRHVYADDLGVASSFLPYNDGMLVAAPPKLVWLKDIDGDDIADERIALMDGFSAGNLQHNFNGLTYGLDNWIYAANGGNSGQPFFIETPAEKRPLRGEDFRFRIEEKILERVGESSGGFELAFDHWGHMYETHNLEHVSHLVFPGRYLEGLPTEPSHTLSIISDHEENGLSRIYPIGEQETRVNHPEQSGYFSGSCGITFYGGGAFPEGFNNQLFVADVVLNLIHIDLLSPDRASFKTSRNREKAEFIASSDRSFRPVNMTTGPDGALYLLDMRRDVIEHPEWIPDEIEATLDLAAGKDKGRIYRIAPKGNWAATRSELSIDQPNELVKALENKNQWTRTTAQRLMIQSQNEALIPLLESLFENTDEPLARLHSLWTLEGLGALKSELLIQAFGDPSPGLRENALKIVEIRLNDQPELADEVLKMTSDADDRVRMQAILTLSTLNEAAFLSRSQDITSALFRLLAQSSTDNWTAMAAAAALQREAVAFCVDLFNGSQTTINENQLNVALTLARLTGRQNDVGQSTDLLRALQKSPTRQTDRTAFIEALANGWERSAFVPGKNPPDRAVLAILTELEQEDSPTVIRATGRLRAAMGLPVSTKMKRQINEALANLGDQTTPLEKRLELLRLVALETFDKREQILYQLTDNREPWALQKEALEQLRLSNKASVGSQLLELWPNLGPQARKLAGNILLYKSFHHDLLLSALENGRIRPGELNFDLERRRVLLFSEDENIKARAEALFSDAGVVTRKEAIDQMRPALALKGETAKGEAIYKKRCGQCHQYGDLGQSVGPPLTEISRKSKESLLHDILDPNAAVDTKYLNHQIRTKDGNIHSGLIYEETDSEVRLRTTGGIETIIPKKDIENLSSLGISLMPEGQEKSMTQQEMANLLAFLQQSS